MFYTFCVNLSSSSSQYAIGHIFCVAERTYLDFQVGVGKLFVFISNDVFRTNTKQYNNVAFKCFSIFDIKIDEVFYFHNWRDKFFCWKIFEKHYHNSLFVFVATSKTHLLIIFSLYFSSAVQINVKNQNHGFTVSIRMIRINFIKTHSSRSIRKFHLIYFVASTWHQSWKKF